MKKLFLLMLLIPNLVIAELKPLSSNKEISEAMTLYRIQRCSGFYYASQWLFNISNKSDMAKSMGDRAINLNLLTYKVGEKLGVSPEGNNEAILAISYAYQDDMESARMSSGNYTDGVVGKDAPYCNSLYEAFDTPSK
jgi:hypothetical protein